MTGTPQIVTYGAWRLDVLRKQCRVDGNVVPMLPGVMELFLFLVSREGEVISKQELIEAVWHGRQVSNAAMYNRVSALRTAIGDGVGSERCLSWEYGRGLRFSRPGITVDGTDLAPRAHDEGDAEISATAATAHRDQTVLAVLSFEVLSNDPELQFLADGISDEIIDKASRFGLIGVLARSTSYSLRGQAIPVREIGERLGAHYILEGTIRQIGARIRLTTRLIDVESEINVWIGGFDISVYQQTEEQDRATTEIAASVITVIYESDSRRAANFPVSALTAWERYCLGYAVFCTLDPDRQQEAAGYLTGAIELAPDFTEAHATLAYSICVGLMTPRADHDLDHLRRGWLEALAHARRALAINPRVPFAWVALGRCNFALGRFDDAISALHKALELNPHLGWAHYVLAFSLLQIGSPKDAFRHFDDTLLTSPQDSLRVVALEGKSIALLLREQYDEAIALSRRAQLLPDAGLSAHLAEVCALGHQRRTEEAQDAVNRARGSYEHFGIGAVEHQTPFASDWVRHRLIEGLKLAGMTT